MKMSQTMATEVTFASVPQRTKRWHNRVKTGCATCRQRRIKCDETKPVCKRCILGKRDCRGYMLSAVPISSIPLFVAPPTESKALHDVVRLFPKMNDWLGSPEGDNQRDLRGCVEGLLGHLPRRAGHSVILDAAIKCLAQGIEDVSLHRATHKETVQFGEYENVNTLKSYAKALSLLRLALQDPVQSKRQESLFAALLICGFESFRRGNELTVQKHLYGIIRIIQYRGPGEYEGDFEQDVLRHYRGIIAMLSFMGNTPCFLSSPDWQSANDGLNSDSHRHKKTDFFLVEIATLVAECSSLVKSQPNVDPKLRDALLLRLEENQRSLQEWHHGWVSEFVDPTDPIDYISLVREHGPKHDRKWLAYTVAAYQAPALLNYRLRVALGCDDAAIIEKQAQSMAKLVHPLYEAFPDVPEPYLLPAVAKSTLDTRAEWTVFSVESDAQLDRPLIVPVRTFARWLLPTGARFQVEAQNAVESDELTN